MVVPIRPAGPRMGIFGISWDIMVVNGKRKGLRRFAPFDRLTRYKLKEGFAAGALWPAPRSARAGVGSRRVHRDSQNTSRPQPRIRVPASQAASLRTESKSSRLRGCAPLPGESKRDKAK